MVQIRDKKKGIRGSHGIMIRNRKGQGYRPASPFPRPDILTQRDGVVLERLDGQVYPSSVMTVLYSFIFERAF